MCEVAYSAAVLHNADVIKFCYSDKAEIDFEGGILNL
jgi:hypothetical protein